jgi:CBS domain-containing protein
MADRIVARDLMRTDFQRIQTDQTLGEAMAALRETQREHGIPSALMVVDEHDAFCGMLTARLLIRILVGEGEADDARLLQVASERLNQCVGDTLIEGIPVVAPDDRLLTMIRRGVATRLDFVAVVDDGRPVGFAPVTAIFQAVAGMALTPGDEGVRFDR